MRTDFRHSCDSSIFCLCCSGVQAEGETFAVRAPEQHCRTESWRDCVLETGPGWAQYERAGSAQGQASPESRTQGARVISWGCHQEPQDSELGAFSFMGALLYNLSHYFHWICFAFLDCCKAHLLYFCDVPWSVYIIFLCVTWFWMS